MVINGNLRRIFPNVALPGVLSKLYEKIDYKKALGDITKHGERGVDAVYKLVLDNNSSNTAVGTASTWMNNMPKNEASVSQLEAAYYKIGSSIQTTADSEAKFLKLQAGISEYELLKAISFQAMAQRKAYMTFFGANPNKKEGLFNNVGETTALPEDSGKNATLTSYIPGELLEALAGELRAIQNLSFNMLKPLVIVAPLDAINYLKSKVVPLTNYQQKGAGTDSVAGTLESIVYDMNGLQLEFVSCSYLKGKGNGGKDVMLFIAPGITQEEMGKDSTAYLNDVLKDNYINTLMDEALPLTETINPSINGVNSWFVEHIITPGIVLRSDAIRALEYQYE